MRRIGLVALAVVVGGNLAVLGASWGVQLSGAGPVRPRGIEGVSHLRAVDAKLWRGAAPSFEGYRALADAGVTTVVDLRAEDGVEARDAEVEALGLTVVHLPIRDGQTPTPQQVERFAAAVRASPGLTFVHCGAGVGRTGAIAATYLIESGGATGAQAVMRNLAVGPPSVEQLYHASGHGPAPVAVVGLSRLLDAPRRLWHNL